MRQRNVRIAEPERAQLAAHVVRQPVAGSTSRQRRSERVPRRKPSSPALVIAGVVLSVILLGLIVLFGVILVQNVFSSEGAEAPVGSPSSTEDAESPAPQETTGTYTISLDASAYPHAIMLPVEGLLAGQEDPATGAGGQKGSSAGMSLKLPLGTPVTALPYLKLDDMRFTGWWTAPDSDASAQCIDNNSLNLLAADTNVTLYARFEPKPKAIDYASPGIPILMYHYFFDPSQGETGEDNNWLDIRTFEEQLIWLRDNGYYYPRWGEVNEYLRGNITLPEKSIVITSDDGNESFYRLAVPLIERYGARITSFVVVKDFDPANLERYDRNHIFFQSHSYDMHRGGSDGDARILTSSYDEVVADVQAGDQVLGTHMVYCYPFGKTNDTAKRALNDSDVQIALVIVNTRAYPMMDMMEIPRVRISNGISLEAFIIAVSP
jgi:peptidoglycan/xylan/chitin deacetylase (PgdA/CDA1 family)